MMQDFSDEQSAGQRLMVGFEGTDLNRDLKFLIEKLCVGGIILFSQNIANPDQLQHLCRTAQNFARDCGQPPLFIAIDQEGGVVARLKKPFTEFAGNSQMTGVQDASEFASICARELSNVGVNMNMAPVLDVAIDSQKSIMSKRAFGSDPDWVSDLGVAVIRNLQRGGIMSVAKHFPGIGRTTVDSHLDLPYLDTELAAMETSDLLPFAAAIENDVAGVMLSHICYQAIDREWPASLSAKIAGDLLRKRAGFEGVVLTDDLDMGAIKRHHDIGTVIGRILEAEIDIALICHKGPDIQKAYDSITTYQRASEVNQRKCARSVNRIMKLKEKYLYV